MIPKSTCYKLVRNSDNTIIAEGSSKNMARLQRANPGTRVWLSGSAPAVGKTIAPNFNVDDRIAVCDNPRETGTIIKVLPGSQDGTLIHFRADSDNEVYVEFACNLRKA